MTEYKVINYCIFTLSVKTNLNWRIKMKTVEFEPRQETNCKKCGRLIVWLNSKSGKRYPVNFRGGWAMVVTSDFHDCKKEPSPIDEFACILETGVQPRGRFFEDWKADKCEQLTTALAP